MGLESKKIRAVMIKMIFDKSYPVFTYKFNSTHFKIWYVNLIVIVHLVEENK